MYCVKCGIRLADGEEKCPLCDTATSLHSLPRAARQPLYPAGQYPAAAKGAGVRNGAILFLFFLLLIEPDLFGRGVLRFRLFLNLGLFRCEDSTDPVSNIFHRL